MTCVIPTNYKYAEAGIVSGLPVYPQGLAECLAHNRCLVNICWLIKNGKKISDGTQISLIHKYKYAS